MALGLKSFRAYTSIEWPIFWRSRYEIAILISIGLLIYVFSARAIVAIDKLVADLGASPQFVSTLLQLVVIVWLGSAAFFWMVRQTELQVPSHAVRVVGAPGFVSLWLLNFLWIALIYIASVRISTEAPLLEELRNRNFLGSNGVILTGTVMCALLIAAFFKTRALFGIGIAVGSMGLAIASWTVAGLGFLLLNKALATRDLYYLDFLAQGLYGKWALALIGLCLPALIVFCVPVAMVVFALHTRAQSRMTRYASATMIWIASALGGISTFLLAVLGYALLMSFAEQFDFTETPSVEVVVPPTILVPFLNVALGLLFAAMTELACRVSVKVLTLPER